MNYYKSLDELPIYNWRMISEKNDISFLLRKKKNINEKEKEFLKNEFEKIYDSFIDTFGISDSYRKHLYLTRDITVLKARLVLEEDLSLLTEIEIAELELRELSSSGENSKSTFNEVKAYVEKYMGFRINQYETSVSDYYSYISLMKKDNGRHN